MIGSREKEQSKTGLVKQGEGVKPSLKAEVEAWKEAETARQRAIVSAKAAKQRAILAFENFREKEHEVENARVRAETAIKEIDQKKQEAEDAKLKVEIASEEALQMEKEAEKAEQKLKLAAEKLKLAKESEKAYQESKKTNFSGIPISIDNKELVSGSATLVLNSGVQYSKISYLTNSLRENPHISIGSSGVINGKGSWVGLTIKDHIPLYHILYNLPFVKEISLREGKIQVTIQQD